MEIFYNGDPKTRHFEGRFLNSKHLKPISNNLVLNSKQPGLFNIKHIYKLVQLSKFLDNLFSFRKPNHVFNSNTVGARIPNKFGIRMVQSCSVLVPTIRKPNFASLDHSINKEKKYFIYKTVQANVAILFLDHSKSEQNGCHLLVPTIRKPNLASLDRFI